MLSFLPPFLTGTITLVLMMLNTLFWSVPVYAVAAVKLPVPIDGWQRICRQLLTKFADAWIDCNTAFLWLMHERNWHIEGLEGLPYHDWYLVISNHVSTADIFVLQSVFNHRIPFLKFFIKQELIWVPVIGLAWWALEFPFMKRYSKAYLAKHPEKRGKDLETTRKACEKFKDIPTSIINFVEGTRITPAKHAQQNSPYTYLLKPKAGGIAYVTAAMGDQLHTLLNVTLVYPDIDTPGFWDFLCGRIPNVIIHIQKQPIPHHFFEGDYSNDPEFRGAFQAWVRALWEEKDALIGRLRAQSPAGLQT